MVAKGLHGSPRVYKSENCFVGSLYHLASCVKGTFDSEIKSLFWSRLLKQHLLLLCVFQDDVVVVARKVTASQLLAPFFWHTHLSTSIFWQLLASFFLPFFFLSYLFLSYLFLSYLFLFSFSCISCISCMHSLVFFPCTPPSHACISCISCMLSSTCVVLSVHVMIK